VGTFLFEGVTKAAEKAQLAFGLRTSEEGNNENLVFLLKKKMSRFAFLSGFT